MPKPSPSQKEQNLAIDTARNKVLLDHAEHIRLAKSWLSGFLGENRSNHGDTEKDDEVENEDEFVIQSELEGVGYISPMTLTGQPQLSDHKYNTTATEKLRKQMLGPRARMNGLSGKPNASGPTRSVASEPLPERHPRARNHRPTKDESDNDDDEQGRSAAVVKKGQTSSSVSRSSAAVGKPAPQDSMNDGEVGLEGTVAQNEDVPAPTTKHLAIKAAAKKRSSGGYMDELLAQRERKRTRKQKGDV